MQLIDGRFVAQKIREGIKASVAALIDSGGENPHLAAVLVGDDPASHTYVNNKEKACREVGIISSVYRHPAGIKEQELLELIDFINNDPEIHGFIVQLPLPSHIDPNHVIHRINPSKDVDGFHPVNIGRMILGLPSYLPATPLGIMKLFEHYKIETEGKHCVILGRSNIVGTPLSILMSRKSNPGNATVTLCHSRTPDVASFIREADILVAAIGKPEFVTADMVKKDVVVIDVGQHRIPDESKEKGFRIVGDVKFNEVSRKASFITPAAGGVGPMTITSLLLNTLRAAKKEVYN